MLSTYEYIHKHVIPAAYDLLPLKLGTVSATVMLLAIGMQESRFQYRRQVNGPARGFWQFESGGGVVGVMQHPASQYRLVSVLTLLQYPVAIVPSYLHAALEHHDVLACLCARLLLLTDPMPLPNSPNEADAGWRLYLRTWRPGKPHRETWDAYFRQAWTQVGVMPTHDVRGAEILKT